MQNNGENIAVKQYNWKGEIIGYQYNNSFIPTDKRNHHYKMLLEDIKDGKCIVNEPDIKEVEKAYDKSNELSGYIYMGMFIPCDNENNLYKLIEKLIEEKTCLIVENKKEQTKKIDSFIFNIVFRYPWKGISNVSENQIKYPIEESNGMYYKVRYVNLNQNNNVINSINSFYNIEQNNFSNIENYNLVQYSMLEITIPVNKLKKIFKYLCKNDTMMLKDELEMHFKQTKRLKKEGPDISWLINYAPIYLKDAVIDIGNRAIEAISFEYLDFNIKHINERNYHNNTIVIKKYVDNSVEIPIISEINFDCYSYNADFKQNSSGMQIANNSGASNIYDYKYKALPRFKIAKLMKNGFILEALSLLNSYLEVSFKLLLCQCVNNDRKKSEIIMSLGHRHRMEIIKEIIKNEYVSNELGKSFNKYLENAKKIYVHRNDYIHDLELPEKSLFMTNVARNKLVNLMLEFVEPYNSYRFELNMSCFSNGVSKEMLELINKHINKKMTNVLK